MVTALVRAYQHKRDALRIHVGRALEELDRPDAPRFVSIPESDRPLVQFPLLGNFVNAPTAAVLYQFREVAMHGRTIRVAHFEQPVFAWK